MRNIILFLCVFYTISVKSQCLEKIKEQSTFFILFDQSDSFSEFGCIKKGINPSCNFRFFKQNKGEFEYSFSYNKYSDIDEAYSKINQNTTFRINKSFIRKNKDIIITREFMEKMGKETMLDILYSDRVNKTIFLINTAKTKKKEVLVQEVTIDYLAPE